jgi:hypothetical protein
MTAKGLLLVLACFAFSAEATPTYIRVCGFSNAAFKNRSTEFYLSPEDFKGVHLNFLFPEADVEALTQMEPFNTVKFNSLISRAGDFEAFVKQLIGRLPLLHRVLNALPLNLTSVKFDKRPVSPAKMDGSDCLLTEALVANSSSTGLTLSGDSSLWDGLSEAQKNVYFFELLLNLRWEALVVDAAIFTRAFSASLNSNNDLEAAYKVMVEKIEGNWVAADVNPLLKARFLDDAEGRRDALDDWLYSFTPWMHDHQFGAKSRKTFSAGLYAEVLARAKAELRIDFLSLSENGQDELFGKFAGAVRDSSLRFFDQMHTKKIPFEQFLNPYTINSYWRAIPYNKIYPLILQASPAYPVVMKLREQSSKN